MRVWRSIDRSEETKIFAERETFTLRREKGRGKRRLSPRRRPQMAHLISPPFSRHVKPLKYEPPRRPTDLPADGLTASVLAAAAAVGRGSPVKPPTNTFPDVVVRSRRDRVKRRRVWLSPNPQTNRAAKPGWQQNNNSHSVVQWFQM